MILADVCPTAVLLSCIACTAPNTTIVVASSHFDRCWPSPLFFAQAQLTHSTQQSLASQPPQPSTRPLSTDLARPPSIRLLDLNFLYRCLSVGPCELPPAEIEPPQRRALAYWTSSGASSFFSCLALVTSLPTANSTVFCIPLHPAFLSSGRGNERKKLNFSFS